MNGTYVLDEHSDVSGGPEVQKQKDIVMDALHNPYEPRPKGEWICGEIVRQWVLCHLILNIWTYPTDRFWERIIPHATAQTQKRFIKALGDSLEAMKLQAIDRRENRIRDIKDYIDMRRDSDGAKPSFVLVELGLDIPDEVMSHPAVEVMNETANDMIWIVNVSDFSVDVKYSKTYGRISHPTM
jgi:hypothetical protein